MDLEEDEDTPYNEVFPIQLTIKEVDSSRGNELRVLFTNELVIILLLLYIEDDNVPDSELV